MFSQTLPSDQVRDLIRGLRSFLKQRDHQLREALLPQPGMPVLRLTNERAEPVV